MVVLVLLVGLVDDDVAAEGSWAVVDEADGGGCKLDVIFVILVMASERFPLKRPPAAGTELIDHLTDGLYDRSIDFVLEKSKMSLFWCLFYEVHI